MVEAVERCKWLLRAIIAKNEALSVKRMRAYSGLKILLEDIAEALPDDEQTAVKEVTDL